MRSLPWLVVLFGSFAFPASLCAQTSKENLDLPYDAIGDSGEEEDAPEVVQFYGTILEGDGFFYTVDHSGSMNDSGELAIAKREIIRNVTEFSEKTQFAIVFFDLSVKKYPRGTQPVEANPGQKQGALGFVNGIGRGSGSCCQKGLLEALRFANTSSAKRKVVVYVGDGGGTCEGANEQTYLQQTLQQVSAQNYQRATVNTIGVLMQGRDSQENFLKTLAAQNGGTYKRIN